MSYTNAKKSTNMIVEKWTSDIKSHQPGISDADLKLKLSQTLASTAITFFARANELIIFITVVFHVISLFAITYLVINQAYITGIIIALIYLAAFLFIIRPCALDCKIQHAFLYAIDRKLYVESEAKTDKI